MRRCSVFCHRGTLGELWGWQDSGLESVIQFVRKEFSFLSIWRLRHGTGPFAYDVSTLPTSEVIYSYFTLTGGETEAWDGVMDPVICRVRVWVKELYPMLLLPLDCSMWQLMLASHGSVLVGGGRQGADCVQWTSGSCSKTGQLTPPQGSHAWRQMFMLQNQANLFSVPSSIISWFAASSLFSITVLCF